MSTLIYHATAISGTTKYALQMPHIYAYYFMCIYQNNNMSSLQSIIEQKHWYTYMSHYWHTPLNKNVCCITYICPTGLTLLSTCRPHITTHIIYKKKLQSATPLLTMLLPYMCQQQIYPSNAMYMPNIPRLLDIHQWGIYANIYATH